MMFIETIGPGAVNQFTEMDNMLVWPQPVAMGKLCVEPFNKMLTMYFYRDDIMLVSLQPVAMGKLFIQPCNEMLTMYLAVNIYNLICGNLYFKLF